MTGWLVNTLARSCELLKKVCPPIFHLSFPASSPRNTSLEMEKLHRMATALVFMLFYFEIERFPGATPLFLTSRIDTDTFARETRRQFFCGEALTNTLEHVCKGSYNHMYKKNSGETSDSELWAALKDSSIYPFRTRQLAKALIPGSLRRSTRGVVDECCKQPCTINEMLSYCEIRQGA